jgi:hypothetical protein
MRTDETIAAVVHDEGAGVRELILRTIASGREQGAGRRELAMNRWHVTIDFDADRVAIEDDLSIAEEVSLSIAELVSLLRAL